MSLTISSDGGGNFELTPAGTHVATCYRIIDLGTQKGEWKGKEKNQPKVLIAWELAHEKMSDGRPFCISKRYTASLSEKSNLRKDLQAWRGRAFTDDELAAFNIAKLLGVPCQLGVAHVTKDGKTYANITAILGVSKGTTVPPLVNEKVHFDLDPKTFDREVYDKLSDNLRETIAKAPEFVALMRDPRLDDQQREEGGGADDHF